ncbi:hypothetical protein ACFSM5_11180 [Lacibacterium aquatile]|uniref:DUF2474 domain-containing protein n=1 Tax=Lacibacterium aquatile TaxID=1168082 RepID=A0ABW5DQP9_9PROT
MPGRAKRIPAWLKAVAALYLASITIGMAVAVALTGGASLF